MRLKPWAAQRVTEREPQPNQCMVRLRGVNRATVMAVCRGWSWVLTCCCNPDGQMPEEGKDDFAEDDSYQTFYTETGACA